VEQQAGPDRERPEDSCVCCCRDFYCYVYFSDDNINLMGGNMKDDEFKYGKFKIGKAHIFNDVPKNEEEALQHGNALAASGNYPVGTSECFNVGISGGCNPECFVYLKGKCKEPQEMIERLDSEGLKLHNLLYR
jgi:hypothetical protein